MAARHIVGLTRPGRCSVSNPVLCSMSIGHRDGPRHSRRVAIIGAGAAGLAAARELRAEGHTVTVLEQSPHVGGVWRYDPRTEADDMLGLNPGRLRVHSSMYEHLRTNLPRELMSFVDFPFDAVFLGPRYSSDPRRFCSHSELFLEEPHRLDRAATTTRTSASGSHHRQAPLEAEPEPRLSGPEALLQCGAPAVHFLDRSKFRLRLLPPPPALQVLGYLEAFADFFELRPFVRTCTRVLTVEPLQGAGHGGGEAAAAVRDIAAAPAAGPAGAGPGVGITAAAAAAAEVSGAAETGFGFIVASERLAESDHHHQQPAASARVASERRGGGGGGGGGGGAAWDASGASGAGRDAATATDSAAARVQREFYDAVVVCNGHYSEPRLPTLRGMAAGGVGGSDSVFPGQQLHSHNYRSAAEWRGKVVLVVGASNSGEDISRELSAGGASRVLLAAWSWKNEAWASDTAPYGPAGNIFRLPMVSELHADGTATFGDGRREGPIDTVIYCTGYRYSFPFLAGAAAAAARVEDSSVGPLWLHMLPPGPLAPALSFVGLPWKVVPFPQFQLQSKLIARLLSGRVQLPSREQMEADIAAHVEAMQTQQLPKRYTHMQGQNQFAYNELLVRLCGPDVAPLPLWRAELNLATGASKRERPDDYRDVDLAATSSAAAAALAAASEDISRQVEQLTGVRGGSLVVGTDGGNTAEGPPHASQVQPRIPAP